MSRIRVGIIGLGNCASALVQGTHFYSSNEDTSGLMSESIGSYKVTDIDYVLGFDVDLRKIGKPIKSGIFELPNCCMKLSHDIVNDCSGRYDGIIYKAPLLDGVSEHMKATHMDDTERFYVASDQANDHTGLGQEQTIRHYASLVMEHKVDVLINYLPVGSQLATEFWATVALEARCNMVNCIPVFIASDPTWSKKFEDRGLSIIGDDMKSQFGASVLSQMFQELAQSRGHKVKVHIQQNSGGNTDFFNMINSSRLQSKKTSKENVLRNHGTEPEFYHAGPSDYIRHFKDQKVATFHLEFEGFCGAPVKLDARLEVQDSPNSAGIVIDAIRYVKVANERKIYGSLEGPSAFTQKSPPRTLSYAEALDACKKYN